MCASVERVDRQPLHVAVPNLGHYHVQSGIGRVLRALQDGWHEQVHLIEAAFEAPCLPVLRNIPKGIDIPVTADLILLPQLTGAHALRTVRGIPSLVIVHDVGIVDCPDDRQSMNWLTRYSVTRSLTGLRGASHIVAVSHFTEHRLLHHIPEVMGRISTIPDGVGTVFLAYDGDQSTARSAVGRLLGRSLNAPLLIYVGSELPRKNIRLLLEAFSRVRATYPGAQLLKVGRPGHPRWRTATLATAMRLDLRVGEDLLFLEDIDDQMLAHAYRAADVFVSSSRYEGFGLPALEAMAVGTPVVVTRCGALPEVVGDVGWLADPEPDRFAQAIGCVLEDADREQRVARGRSRAASLTWAATAGAYLDLMHQLVDSSPLRGTRRQAKHHMP